MSTPPHPATGWTPPVLTPDRTHPALVDDDTWRDFLLTRAWGKALSGDAAGSLADFQLHAIPLSSMTQEAVKDTGLSSREAERSKNMFALGLMSWLYHRPVEGTIEFIEAKFGKRPEIAEANMAAATAAAPAGHVTPHQHYAKTADGSLVRVKRTKDALGFEVKAGGFSD